MNEKLKFEQEYIFKTSLNALNNLMMTPSGLSEWFADDVNIKDDIYTFIWDGSMEQARLITAKHNDHIKFQWLEDEEKGLKTYVELKYKVDPMTKEVILNLTSFATKDEMEEVQAYWESTIEGLRMTLGA